MSYAINYMICAYLARKQEEADRLVQDIKDFDFGKDRDDCAYADLAIAEARRATVDQMTTDILNILRYYRD